ncbi:hypothetical protein [Streptomyces justiciae]|uniref:hypothetical protein n=1 Tax=Streptomyces justiciae TaxID=2780140 RepID=UPI0021196721|nr:hypothetical protein [Streptomyces justiciae]MCW8383980.1 hypothetical protein [Streptomyces justiciae]
MPTYTFICDWSSYEGQLLDDPFVIVAAGENLDQASTRAAEAALIHYPELAETLLPSTFWAGDGGTQLAALYGDQSANLVDRDVYDIINAESLIREND